MSKILFIGNSHVGAIKAGYDLVGKDNLKSNQISFFGLPRDNLFNTIDIKKLEIIKHPKYRELISLFEENDPNFSYKLNSYDYVVWVQNYCPLDPRCFYNKKSKTYFQFSFLSDSLIEEIIHNEINLKISSQTVASNLVSAEELSKFCILRKVLGRKFIFLGMPFEIRSTRKKFDISKFDFNQTTVINFKQQKEKIQLIFDQWKNKNKFKYIFPPEFVLDETGIYTKGTYAIDGVKVGGGFHNRKGDIHHMNANYGREIILSFINQLS